MADEDALLSTKLRPAPSVEQERAHAEALFASIGEGVIATDEHGKIIRFNQIALDILKCQKGDLAGKWFPEVMIAIREDGTIIDALDRPIAKAVMAGEPVSERLIYMNNEGITIPVAITVSPIMFEGRPIGAVQVFRDITAEMQQDKLKTDFISLASHQLRTPLSAINLYSQMLQDGYAGDLNSDQQRFLEVIVGAVDRMNSLINMLLNITRIEAGSIAVNPQPLHIAKLAGDIIKEFKPEARDKHIRLTAKFSDDLPTIHSDALLIKEILSNFLSNAIKYTPPEGKVTISMQKKAHSLVCCVKDSGYGIPKSGQRQIFTKFFRADNVLEHDVSGTGLGLYLTKTIIEYLQGEVWFESKEMKGSSFYFSLPVKGLQTRAGKFKIES